eukprot:15358763-Ditylum_brightwellii.AAC.1
MLVKFTSEPAHFLGIQFETIKEDNDITIFLSQEATIKVLITELSLDLANTVQSPYRSGYPIDKIPTSSNLPPATLLATQNLMRSIAGLLNWLSCETRIDVTTVMNILAKYMHSATPSHVVAAKYVVKYLKGCKHLGITFSTKDRSKLEAYLNFLLDKSLTALTDTNWGPQDAMALSNTGKLEEVNLFKSRSISGFVLWFNGPIHWVFKQQTITARSSAEAKVYATDKCVKMLLHINHILTDMGLKETIMGQTTIIFNDNQVCVSWVKT